MNTKLIAGLALLAVILIISWMLHRRDRDQASQLNLEDLLIGDDGRLSKAAAVMMGAFGLTTWLMVYLALTGKMTEGYLAIYVGAWIAPTVAVIIKRPAEVPASTIETSTTSTTKVKEVQS
jgi:preprotein translocase subunit SecG